VLDAIDAAVAAAEADDDGPLDIDVVEERINERYRNAHIVVRDHFSAYELMPVWYAYRDGRVRPFDAQRERLYASLDRAREVLEQSDAAIEHSRAAARSAGYR